MEPSEPRMQVAPPRVASAASALPQVEALSSADVAAGVALSDAAGWNQVADDWAIFIEHGRTFGARDGDGRVVATAAALPYGAAAGWVSMVLVDEAWRHRGLATALVRECVAHLQSAGALPLLDATTAGAAVYRGLGFVEGFAFDRWHSNDAGGAFDRGAADDLAEGNVQAAGLANLDRIAELDASSSDLERRFLFARVLARADARAWFDADRNSVVMTRRGGRATQIGPLVAANGRQAIALLGTALAATTGAVYVDVPAAQQEVAGWLERRGFRRQRSFVRMSLGAAYPPEAAERAFVLAGPEFG